jgi:hypothetical protein
MNPEADVKVEVTFSGEEVKAILQGFSESIQPDIKKAAVEFACEAAAGACDYIAKVLSQKLTTFKIADPMVHMGATAAFEAAVEVAQNLAKVYRAAGPGVIDGNG